MYSAFWCSQMMASLLMMLVMLHMMGFQKRLGALYATVQGCWHDLAVFTVCFFVLSFSFSVVFHITVGPYYDKMATLSDAFYCITLGNVAGSQGLISGELFQILETQGITGLQVPTIFLQKKRIEIRDL